MKSTLQFFTPLALLLGALAPLTAQAEVATAAGAPETRAGTLRELIRVRCSTDGEDQWTVWQGKLFSFVPGRRPELLFDLVGANVARCAKDSRNRWFITSRELMYYLDPETGERVDRWRNPLTTEEVPVVHVANDLVQSILRGSPDITTSGPLATLRIDIPLFYPNALFRDANLKPYSPMRMYQAAESFGLVTTTAALSERSPSAPMSFTWHRLGPWLPWMNMGRRPGILFYSADGSKVSSYEQLPALIRQEIDARLPRYRNAPRCYVRRKNVTSWSYFSEQLEAYKGGETQFPAAAPLLEGECPAG